MKNKYVGKNADDLFFSLWIKMVCGSLLLFTYMS